MKTPPENSPLSDTLDLTVLHREFLKEFENTPQFAAQRRLLESTWLAAIARLLYVLETNKLLDPALLRGWLSQVETILAAHQQTYADPPPPSVVCHPSSVISPSAP